MAGNELPKDKLRRQPLCIYLNKGIFISASKYKDIVLFENPTYGPSSRIQRLSDSAVQVNFETNIFVAQSSDRGKQRSTNPTWKPHRFTPWVQPYIGYISSKTIDATRGLVLARVPGNLDRRQRGSRPSNLPRIRTSRAIIGRDIAAVRDHRQSDKTNDKQIRSIKQRTHYFEAQITSLQNFASNYQGSSKEQIILSEKIERLRLLFDKFNANQNELALLIDDYDAIEQQRETVTNHYDDVIATALELSATSKSRAQTQDERDNARDVQRVSKADPTIVRLPKIDLPKFDGRMEKWVTFKDAFVTMIHSHPSLSNIQKMNYLQLSLTGQAQFAIGAFRISEDNYETAWNHLAEIYDNKRALVLRHAALLRETPKMPNDSSEAIRDLASYMQLHIRSLQALGRNWEDIANDLLTSILVSRMGKDTRKCWEQTLSDTEMPKLMDIFKFLNIASHQSKDYESTTPRPSNNFNKSSPKYPTANRNYPPKGYRPRNSPPSSPNLPRRQTFATQSKQQNCAICEKGPHKMFQCKAFERMTVDKRIEAAKTAKVCLNCLLPGHPTGQCNLGKCKVCNMAHNTRLHRDPTSPYATLITDSSTHDLLTTAIVHAFANDNRPIECRTLLDTCSNANLITEEFAKKLRLNTEDEHVSIEVLNELNTVTTKTLRVKVKSRINDFNRTLKFFIIPRISGLLPDRQVNKSKLHIPSNIQLADPHFHRPSNIDMLIGSGTTLACLSIGQIEIGHTGQPDLILQKSQFGWIIGGSVPSSSTRSSCKTFANNINFDLRNFWEVEEGPPHSNLSPTEIECESLFKNTVQRLETGQYMVSLPFNGKEQHIGESRTRALNRFLSLERRFSNNPELKTEYTRTMNEYIELGHMSPAQNIDNSRGYYLPHHAVIKTSSSTTKCRVVFDGSAKSSDIEKMYRQFFVRPEDRPYQRILWRDNKNAITTFELNTVTFGLSAAPYLAIRCLHQLASDEYENFPRASTIISKDVYVDDLLTGTDNYDDALALRDEIINLLKRGKLNIRQWVSNDQGLLTGLSTDQIHPKYFGDSTVKTLGISWDPKMDAISYTVNVTPRNTYTKRIILSTIAKIFDPLGLLGPITIIAKILVQRLWQLKVDWDESLPMAIQTEWSNYQEQLRLLENLRFERHVSQSSIQRLEIHGFCDASERAYGACIYIRSIDSSGTTKVQLLCAKSRVAPLKTISLARLELCGANLLASLYVSVKESLTHQINDTTLWTDSTIVLHWLNKSPNLLKTFVANRVTEIQAKTNIHTWRHIRSSDNPADLLSRGIIPKKFVNSKIWRNGPEWLLESESLWPRSCLESIAEVPDLRKVQCFTVAKIQPFELLDRYSCIKRLRRVISYCLRFLPANRMTGPISIKELERANEKIIQLTQAHAFSDEISDLKSKSGLNNKSKLRSLNPFIDEKGILRVGGRLQNSDLEYERKHPILLPKGHHITDIIIRDIHIENYHSGLTATLYNVRQTYWPIDGKNTTRKILRNCVKCFRVHPPTTNYVMGNLPATRVLETRPFTNVGIDYCGPFFIKERRHRNRTRVKVYVAVFICFSTKAVHLEVVGDMTTEAFLAALKRFIGRRGKCTNIYSDNGTNFVGANNELHELHKVLRENDEVNHFITDKGISWHFMPALSPHFGGLWEAAVKSLKHHLKRVVGDELFTYEQFATFVTEIEAILNSRPLTPLSSDPNDPLSLTPGHFLIGTTITSVPEADFTASPNNRLSNWQHIQKVKQDFWKRWSKEYIQQLNVRAKWVKGSHDIKEGTVVILKDDRLPPLQWNLGRVLKIHPGTDDIIRAVTVQTSNGIYKRNVKQLAPLPIVQDDSKR
ncbi:uncharacterized protein LOC143363666 [Halictus rubicundus]|uniref:uncharacterized protein LOC143363666 n=1 Tax=Halictus rubicundus TaxID=77578 RepID=UPI00403700DE